MMWQRKYKALVAEDNEELRTLTARALSQEGFTCEEAADGVTASEMLTARRYDVVIVDLILPKKHGHKLIVELRESEVPPMIIVATGITDPRIVADLLARGVEDVFHKPIIYGLFAAKVRALLDRRAAQKGASGPAKTASVAAQIQSVATDLKSQLALVQASFQETISSLDKQKTELEAGFLGSVRMLTNLIDQVGQSRGSHAVRVEKMAAAIGEKAGLSKSELTNLKIAALLHDIGQFGMSDDTRRKAPWELSPDEKESFQKYPSVGAILLSEVPGADNVVALIESHAENFDGSGFPAGLSGADIPVSARILRIADGIDTFRVHAGEDSGLEHTRKHLYAEISRSYDPDLVNLAVACLRESDDAEKEEKVMTIPLSELHAGQVIAEDLFDERGRFLVRKGLAVSPHMVTQLPRLVRLQTIKVYVPHEAVAPPVPAPQTT